MGYIYIAIFVIIIFLAIFIPIMFTGETTNIGVEKGEGIIASMDIEANVEIEEIKTKRGCTISTPFECDKAVIEFDGEYKLWLYVRNIGDLEYRIADVEVNKCFGEDGIIILPGGERYAFSFSCFGLKEGDEFNSDITISYRIVGSIEELFSHGEIEGLIIDTD